MVARKIVGTGAVLATLSLVGCGTAANISGGGTYTGAALTTSTFASAVTSATSQSRSVHINGVVAVQGQHVTFNADAARPVSSGGTPSAVATVSVAGMAKVEVRIVDGSLYVNRSQLPMLPVPGDKPWVKVPLGGSSSPFGSLFGQIGSLRGDLLGKTFHSVTHVTKLGPANIDSVQTMHYRVTVNVSQARSLLGVPPQAGSAQLPRTITYDVWLDSQNRPTMVSMVNPNFSLTLTFSDWNEPVHVIAPPASQVSTLPR